jgi:NTE family protein
MAKSKVTSSADTGANNPEFSDASGSEPQAEARNPAVSRSALASADREWRVIMALQGGGALGAFQMGAYEALAEDALVKQANGTSEGEDGTRSLLPDWVTGISIGSINASIIAGNPPERRVERLKEFWQTVASPPLPWSIFSGIPSTLANSISLFSAVAFGQPGFFRPWFPPPALASIATPPATSYYSTALLRETLSNLIDFDLLSAKPNGRDDVIRISLGATRIDGGRLVYFDNQKEGAPRPSAPEYVMASGALPPAFGAVEVDGEYYWDGGVVSNSALAYLGREVEVDKHTIIFLLDLWTPAGVAPDCMDAVTWHEKQVRFSNRISTDIQRFCLELMRRELHRKVNAVDSPPPTVDIVRVRYRHDSGDVPYGDADFSVGAIKRRRNQGYATMRAVVAQMNQSGVITRGGAMSETADFAENTWIPDQPGPVLCMRGSDGGWVRLHNY